MSVSVSNMTHKFTGRRERCIAVFTSVGSDSGVSIDMVLQRCNCLKGQKGQKLNANHNQKQLITLNPRSQIPHLCGRSSL